MVLINTILVCDRRAPALFDLSSTFSYVCEFATDWDLDCEYLGTSMCVFILVRVFVYVDQVCHACFVMFIGFKTLTDFIIIDMEKFDLILGMSWLSLYDIILYCYAKTAL